MNCEWIGWCALTAAEQAAWVQAVGSITAIAVAIVIPRNSERRRELREVQKEHQERAKEIAIARSHSVNLIKELDVVSETLHNKAKDLETWSDSNVTNLAKATWGNPPGGGRAYRTRTASEKQDISSMASTLHQMLSSFEVSKEMRENAPRLAFMPATGDTLLSLVVSLDQLHAATRAAWKSMASDEFKSNPFLQLKDACENTKDLADKARKELISLFPNAIKVE